MAYDLFSLSGKRILVTGGTRGIGGAISARFVKAGASVIANYVRNQKAADELAQSLNREGCRIDFCRADLTSQKGLEVLTDAIATSGGRLSAVVHCAATGVHRRFEDLEMRHFDWTFALNVRAFFALIRRLLPTLESGASIVALSSQGALQAIPFYSVLGASKGAVESLVRQLALELGPRGIRVNCLAPGSVLTEAWEAMPEKEARIAHSVQRTPLGRLATPDDVAWAAQFLCSDASRSIHGHTLVVDGGARVVA